MNTPVTTPASTCAIDVKNLTVGYGSNVLMKDLNFTVNNGEIFVILGGSGCGKSSLFKNLFGLYQPLSGDVLIEAAGGKALALNRDLSDASVIDGLVSKVEKELGPVDILINNTGGPPPTPAAGQDPALWQKSFNDMVLSLIAITDRVLPGMRERKWGRVITSTTSGAIAPIKNLAISNTLRAALLAWSKTLAAEVAADGVTVNIIMPGRISTDRLRQLDEAKAKRENSSYEAVVKASINQIPMGRYGDPVEYGDAAAFLASQNASFITGTVMRVDGGQIQAI